MKKLLLAAAMLSVSVSAHASIIPTLTSVTPTGSDFTWLYQGTLAGDQGLQSGSKLVILDFRGYVPGSISPDGAPFTASVENVTSGIILPFGQTDDPTIANLVFTYNGPDFHTTGGPFKSVDFSGLSAESMFGGFRKGVFSAVAEKNNGVGPGGTGTITYNTGYTSTPGTGIPEPATWALTLCGFGLLGATLRGSRRQRAGQTA